MGLRSGAPLALSLPLNDRVPLPRWGRGGARLLPSLHERVRTQTGLGNGGGSGDMGAPRSGGAWQGIGGKKLLEVCLKLAGGRVRCDPIPCVLFAFPENF